MAEKTVTVFSPDGERGEIPAAQLPAAIQQGYKLPSESEHAQFELERKYEETPGWRKAAAIPLSLGAFSAARLIPGVDEYLPLPPRVSAWGHAAQRGFGAGPIAPGAIGQAAVAAEDPGYAEKLSQEQSAFPVTSAVGEAGSALGSAFAMPGLGGLASEGLAAKGYGKLAQFAGRGAGTVADTVGWGASKNLAEGILDHEDHDALAEKLIASAGTDAMWGLGGFGAGEVIGAGARAIKGRLGGADKTAKEALMRGVKGTPTQRLDILNREARGDFGTAEQPFVRSVDEMMNNSFSKDGKAYKASPKSVEAIDSWASEQKEHWQKEIGKVFQKPEVADAVFGPQQAEEFAHFVRNGGDGVQGGLYEEVARKLDPSKPIEALTEVNERGRVVRKFVDNLDEANHPAIMAVEKQLDRLTSKAAAKEMTLEDVWKFRQDLDRVVGEGKGTIKDRLLPGLRDATDNFILKQLESRGLGEDYQMAKRFWLTANILDDMASKRVATAEGLNMWGLGKFMFNSIGVHLGGVPGLGATTALSAIAGKTFGDLSMFHIARKMMNRQAVIIAGQHVDKTISEGIANFIRNAPSRTVALNPYRDIHSDFEKASKEMADANANAPYVTEKMGDYTKSLNTDMPKVAASMMGKGAGSLSNLRLRLDALHQSITQKPSVTPLAVPKTQLPDSSKYKYLREQRAIRQPLSLMDDIQGGQVYPSTVQAVEENYPKLMEQIRQELVTQLSTVEEPLTRAQLETVSLVLGQPADGVAGDNEFGDWLQKVAYTPNKDSSLKSMGNQRQKSPGMTSLSQTDSQRVAGQS